MSDGVKAWAIKGPDGYVGLGNTEIMAWANCPSRLISDEGMKAQGYRAVPVLITESEDE